MTAFTGFKDGEKEPKTKQELDAHYDYLLKNHKIRIVKRVGYELHFEDGVIVTMSTLQEIQI